MTSFCELGATARRLEVPERALRHLKNVMAELGPVVRTAARTRRISSPGAHYALKAYLEPYPNPSSRVELSGDGDRFGQPRARVRWQLTEADRRTLRRLLEITRTEIERTGSGRVRIMGDDTDTGWPATRPRGFRILTPRPFDTARSPISHGFEALWWIYGGALIVVLLLLLISDRRIDGARGFRMRPRLLAIFPLLVLLNGAGPYLGLKTESSFSMFSNLQTEASYANHLILGVGVRLADWQDDLVYIESSSDEELSRLTHAGYALPFFEFRSYVSRRVGVGEGLLRVTYVRGDRRVEVGDAAKDRELASPDRWLARRFLWFRPVFTGSSPPCIH